MRKTTGAIICSECGKLISVGEERCPFCGAWRPGLFGYAPWIQRFFGSRLDLSRLLITTCLVVYGLSLLIQPEAIFSTAGIFDLLSPGRRALYQLGMTGGLAWQAGWWWTLFTAIYLHGSVFHIAFNMFGVWNLGAPVAQVFGPARAFVIFSISGAAGFLLSNLATAAETIGASGSIFGLLAALIVYGRRRGATLMTRQLWQWALIMFVFGFFTHSVNNWAHGGGFAGGWVVAEAMAAVEERRENRTVQLLALALLGLTAAGFVLSFVQVTRALLAG